ncbi:MULTISPECIES: Flp pilus assembly protein CpaB [unclassified Modestobacter]|uniref:Flp pilus assembly protein CpaB n=1 Tax=unclassified Modestobacter TaxID=2643866 RepID=UPI0022AB49D3|nr:MULTISPECIES: Flp pilus assembly protein CpaB [unclassified Modestobacter]MCZ2825209.1 Flp pilus assembly protein CpaB [Modestobacter sp. VKM Ac-2981]MCZ2853726.1 Flp pilus assembly protein CpaB [Modestobacter sp. VKM Ac-2982]
MHLLRQVAAAALVCLALVLALRPPPPGPAGPVAATSPVVVAAADLPAGTVLTVGDLAEAELPTGLLPSGGTADAAGLTGQLLAAPVRAGEPVTDVRLVGPGLWSAVPDGQVAAPVRLADLAVATLLRAGDRVDVLAAGAAGPTPSPAVEVVATGALVLAAPTPAVADGPAAGAPAGGGLLVLAVSPDTAARLAAAAATATLTVTLGRP